MGCGASALPSDSIDILDYDDYEESLRQRFLNKTLVETPFLLPPQKLELSGRKTLVLDMDETLVHSSPNKTDRFHYRVTVNDPSKITFYVLERPGLRPFLSRMSDLFEVVIFTASTQKYADAVIESFDTGKWIHHRLYRPHCTVVECRTVKDLGRLGRNLKDVIIVDDTPDCYFLHPRNAFPISRFIDDHYDDELLFLADRLEALVAVTDVRRIAV